MWGFGFEKYEAKELRRKLRSVPHKACSHPTSSAKSKKATVFTVTIAGKAHCLFDNVRLWLGAVVICVDRRMARTNKSKTVLITGCSGKCFDSSANKRGLILGQREVLDMLYAPFVLVTVVDLIPTKMAEELLSVSPQPIAAT